MKYVYPAILLEEEDKTFSVLFPDFVGAAKGYTISEVITEASTALSLLISSYIDGGDELPTATELDQVKLDDDLEEYKDKYTVTLIQADPKPFLKK